MSPFHFHLVCLLTFLFHSVIFSIYSFSIVLTVLFSFSLFSPTNIHLCAEYKFSEAGTLFAWFLAIFSELRNESEHNRYSIFIKGMLQM